MSAVVQQIRFADIDRWDPPSTIAPTMFRYPTATLGEIADVRLGLQVPRKGSRPVGVKRPYLRAMNVRRGHVDTADVRTMYLSESQARELTLHDGDLLFVEGSGSITEVGRAARWDGSVDDCVHQNSVVRARVTAEDLDLDYLVTWFNSRAGNAYIRSMATTTSGLFHIGANKLTGMTVPLPPTDVQHTLVTGVAAARQAALDTEMAAHAHRRAAWAQFEQGTSHAAAAVADTGKAAIVSFAALDRWDVATSIETLTSPYPLHPLADLGDIRLGTQIPRKGSDAPGTHTRYLRAANVQKGRVDLSDVRTMAATPATVERLRLRDGDLLVVEGNSEEEVGRAAVWRGDDDLVIIQNSIIRVQLDRTLVDPDFVAAWLNSDAGRAYVRRRATTTSGSLWHIGAAKLAGAPIPVPPLPDQRAFVATLNAALATADELLRQAEEHRERAETLVDDLLVL
ncbi:hypothetical protein [Microbacterium sp. NPDC090003]|uniref:restriction endonuclease subunit S n=1 Tax=Microbacterium sp. NPDC090003 TaxID=3364203 RepID=UPI0037F7DC1C